jgi:type I restriction enzyme, S subunit
MAVWSEVSLSLLSHGYRIDSEFYRNEYIKKDDILNHNNLFKLGSLGIVTDGEHGSVSFINNGIKYLTAENIKSGYVDISKIRYVGFDVDQRNARARVFIDDILVSIKGTLGQISLAEKWLLPANMNRDVAIIKIKSHIFDNAFIALFLQSKYGLYQLAREGSGGVQQMITLGRLRGVRIPYLEDNIQEKIAFGYRKSLELAELSKSLYTHAQGLLEQELGLHKLKFEKLVGVEAKFSEATNNNRIDADYYQTHFRILNEYLKTINTKHLSIIANFKKGIEVGSSSYTKEGKLFIRVSNVKEIGIETSQSDKYISEQKYFAIKSLQPIVGDLLLTKDGTPGVCYSVDKIIEGVISSGIVRLKLHDSSILNEYLALVINSRICRMQIERACSGALILHWKPRDISRLQIPILPDKLMQELSDMVVQSKQAKLESNKLLEQAKGCVEELIEEAVTK